MSTNKQALRIPEREKHNWGQAVMHTCDFCSQYAMTITTEGGEHRCASCCDAEYATVLTCALEVAIDRAEVAERRIAELEERVVSVPNVSNEGFWVEFNGRLVFREETYRSAVFKALDAAGITVKGE